MFQLGALPAVPEVPAGGDRAHSADEIGAYATWIDARANEFQQALTSAQATQNGQAILVDFIPWFATWKVEFAKLQADLSKWSGGVGALLTNPWTYLPGGSGANPLVGAWERLRLKHAQLIEYARRMETAGLARPELPGLPTAPPLFGGGGPSATTIAVFAAGVGGLAAYLAFELAPLPSKPTAALVGGIIGAGGTFLLLR